MRKMFIAVVLIAIVVVLFGVWRTVDLDDSLYRETIPRSDLDRYLDDGWHLERSGPGICVVSRKRTAWMRINDLFRTILDSD